MEKDRKFVVFLALCFAFAIMFFGLLIGLLINNYQKETMDKELDNIKIRSQEIILFSNLLNYDIKRGNIDCNFYDSSLDSFAVYLNGYGRMVEKYYRSASELEDIKDLQKDYVVSMLGLYNSIEYYNSVCSSNYKNTIMYFYPYNCGVCDGITKTINNVVYSVEGVFSFSIPSEIGLEIVDFQKKYYGIDIIPSVVVNGKVISGSNSFNDIEKYVK